MDTARKAHDSIRYIGADQVLAAISPQRAIDAVERALAGLERGEVRAPKSIGEAVPDGTFHVKACAGASGDLARLYVAKVNANFPENMARHGMPTIQGAILAFDTRCGKLLAAIESASVTMLRTAATSAVAFRHLARKDSSVATIIGCGAQGEAHLRVLAHVLPIEKVFLFDMDAVRARSLAERAADMGLAFTVSSVPDIAAGTMQSDVVVTCTSSKTAFLEAHHVRNGTCVAAVGADNEQKAEIGLSLLRSARIVTDQATQCAKTGDLRRLAAESARGDWIDLGRHITTQSGRVRDDEVVVFDSCGLAAEDLALVAELLEP
jgi:alanine dehydrogenase